ncbi:hypothetical protein D3C83_259680 [compost metagenome]
MGIFYLEPVFDRPDHLLITLTLPSVSAELSEMQALQLASVCLVVELVCLADRLRLSKEEQLACLG